MLKNVYLVIASIQINIWLIYNAYLVYKNKHLLSKIHCFNSDALRDLEPLLRFKKRGKTVKESYFW